MTDLWPTKLHWGKPSYASEELRDIRYFSPLSSFRNALPMSAAHAKYNRCCCAQVSAGKLPLILHPLLRKIPMSSYSHSSPSRTTASTFPCRRNIEVVSVRSLTPTAELRTCRTKRVRDVLVMHTRAKPTTGQTSSAREAACRRARASHAAVVTAAPPLASQRRAIRDALITAPFTVRRPRQARGTASDDPSK